LFSKNGAVSSQRALVRHFQVLQIQFPAVAAADDDEDDEDDGDDNRESKRGNQDVVRI